MPLKVDDITYSFIQSGYVDPEFLPRCSTLILDRVVKENDLRGLHNLLKLNSSISPRTLASLMWYAIYKHYNSIVFSLIMHGADVNQSGLRKWKINATNSLLSWAVSLNNTDAAKLLIIHKANVNDWNFNLPGVCALYFALLNSNVYLTKLLLQSGADTDYKCVNENSMLHIAAASCNEDLVRIIAVKMSDVNVTNRYKQNALHYAVQCIPDDNYKVVEQLINYKVSVNALDEAGETPLFYALILKKPLMAITLLESGAKVNLISKNEVFPLHLCIASRCSLSVTKFIILKGGLINQKTYDGDTMLHIACRKKMGSYVRLLLNYGCDINVFNMKEQLPASLVKKKDHKTAEVILEHIVKLKNLNLPVHEQNLEIIKMNEPFKHFFNKYFGVFYKRNN